MLASTRILEILESSDIKPAQARVIAKAFEEADREVEVKIEKRFDEKSKDLATKGDFANLQTEIHVSKAEIIKRVFLFWIGLIPVMILIVKYIR